VAGISGAVMTTTPIIEIRDANGFTTASTAAVTATILSPTTGGSLGGATVNASGGVANFSSLSLAGLVGTSYVLRFTSGSLTVDAAATSPTGPGSASQLILTRAPIPGASGAALATQPVVEVRDSGGNLVPGSTAAVAVALHSGAGGTLGGTLTANASGGVATFNDVALAGVVGTSYVLRFTSSGLTQVLSGNLTPTGHGVATQLAVTTQPGGGASGGTLATPPVITVRDSAGNTVADSAAEVTVSVTPSSGILGGPTAVNAANGVATFTGLTLAGTVNTNYTLTFTVTGLPSVSASSVTVTPGTATQLALTTAPVTGASATALTTQPVVTIRDAQGNTVTSSTATVTVTVVGAGGALGGTLTANAVNGVATFSGVTLAGVVGTSYVLRFTSSGLTPIDSAGVTPSGHGVATQLAVTTQPGGGASGGALSTLPVIAIRDSAGNTVLNSTVAVTVAIQSGTGGTLGGRRRSPRSMGWRPSAV